MIFERLPGRIPFGEAHARQLALRAALESGTGAGTVLLLEHAPVITLGRKSDPAHVRAPRELLDALGVDVCVADRGGDVTYHGPGQMVAYPVLDLRCWRCSVNWYLRSLEEVLIRLLDCYGLEGGRLEGFTGVWVDGAKVAAIGVGIHQWVTFHGIALNVDPDWRHWDCIVPCGIADKPLTSLARLLGETPPMAEVMDRFQEAFSGVFGNEAAP